MNELTRKIDAMDIDSHVEFKLRTAPIPSAWRSRNVPERPSPWNAFFSERLKELKTVQPPMSYPEMQRKIFQEWKEMTQEQRRARYLK